VNYNKFTYTYNANNNMISELQQNWNSSAWVNSYYDTCTYDANNNLISEFWQSWNVSNWMNYQKLTYIYDGNNNQTSFLFQTWGGSIWVNYYQFTYTYDANNNRTSEFEQSWKNGNWVNFYKDTKTYDANDFTKNNSYKYWNNVGIEVIIGDSDYYYYHTVLGINDLKLQDGNITVYPNPTCGKFTISSDKPINSVEIYNLLGERIYSDFTFNRQISKEIDLSDRCQGVYAIKIYNGKGIYNCKIVVQ